mmetsp:Transcript_59776/g.164571  ORF Transcript_59776/g.164571 Transcript_59776/m.164571 type:complete len:221 (-) Transcript_59776:188-850(-)
MDWMIARKRIGKYFAPPALMSETPFEISSAAAACACAASCSALIRSSYFRKLSELHVSAKAANEMPVSPPLWPLVRKNRMKSTFSAWSSLSPHTSHIHCTSSISISPERLRSRYTNVGPSTILPFSRCVRSTRSASVAVCPPCLYTACTKREAPLSRSTRPKSLCAALDAAPGSMSSPPSEDGHLSVLFISSLAMLGRCRLGRSAARKFSGLTCRLCSRR